ncbi:MAG: hypothetical protein ACRDTF_15505 [Pseudonocardiaceae bacterium]
MRMLAVEMNDVFSVFSAAMKGVLGPGWWSTWPLSTRHAVGDVCSVVEGQLLSAGTLGSLGVSTPALDSPYRDAFTYDSAGSVVVTLKASGVTGPLFQALVDADAGAHLSFSRGRSVFAAFAGLRQAALEQPHELAKPLVELYFQRKWEPDWVAVTHILSAESGTVLIAANDGAEAELRLGVSAQQVGVGDLAGQVRLARSKSIGLDWFGDADSTPFCRVARLRKSWLGRIDADFAPRQKVKGLAPSDIPVRILQQAAEKPDDVVEMVNFSLPDPSV